MTATRCTSALSGMMIAALVCGAFGRPHESRAQVRPVVRFEREHIRVAIRPGGIRVEGTYVFRSEDADERTIPLFYPFPVDSMHPWPTFVGVYSQEDEPLSFTRPRPDGILFRVVLPARGRATVRVVYEQPSLDSTGCYILTTTGAWERPLERAEFEVSVPAGIELESIAYEADDVVVAEDARVYRFARENFMPTVDLCVRWRVRQPR